MTSCVETGDTVGDTKLCVFKERKRMTLCVETGDTMGDKKLCGV